jgi:hypothetical protein
MESYVEALRQNCHFEDILGSLLERIGGSQLETLSIVLEQEHFELLLEGLKEAKAGNVVSFKDAFSDLN